MNVSRDTIKRISTERIFAIEKAKGFMRKGVKELAAYWYGYSAGLLYAIIILWKEEDVKG